MVASLSDQELSELMLIENPGDRFPSTGTSGVPESNAVSRGFDCTVLKTEKAYRIDLPADPDPNDFVPGGRFEQTCADFILNNQQLLIDGRKVKNEGAIKALCNSLVRMIRRFGEMTSRMLRIAIDLRRMDLVELIYTSVRDYKPALAPHQVFLLGSALYALFLGPLSGHAGFGLV